ncbi:MAG: serine--tRNA ligase [Pseudomonadota bacterium]|nr:serine--tRNA ligase [Pseudomonadota bacterium]
MIDPKLLKQSTNEVSKNLARRGYVFDAEVYLSHEKLRKSLQVENEELKNKRNTVSKEIGIAKSKKKDASVLMKTSDEINSLLAKSEKKLNDVLSKINAIELDLPNLLSDKVPDGNNENDNEVIRNWGKKRSFDFSVKDHVEIGKNLGSFDFDSAGRISGSRFSVIKGSLAALQRALIQFMLDLHTREHDYEEFYVPYIVQSDALIGTSQLPKFESDLFKIDADRSLYLIPTAEVPLTNLFGSKIVDADSLPRKLVAHTPCFRSEAGSYGKDTKGLIRQHQFEKVELVQIVTPENSNDALESLTNHAEKVLQALELPYRVVSLCAGDIGFGSTFTYDLEVWLPGQQAYREISSCSLFGDFQARRMQAKYKNTDTGKNEFLHTINGSGVAAGRALVAVMENHQNKDGSIQVPSVLLPYMNNLETIS